MPLPSTDAVVYGAMLMDEGTRTGVSILYVSVPRCSKRCAVRVNAYLFVKSGGPLTLNWTESTGGRRLIESRLFASCETLPHF